MSNQCIVKKQAIVEFLSSVGNDTTQLALFKGYLEDISKAFTDNEKLRARMSLQQFVLSKQMKNDLYKADIISNIQRYGVATDTADILKTLDNIENSKKLDDEVLSKVMGVSKSDVRKNRASMNKGFENKLLYDYLYNLNFGKDTTLRRVDSATYKESGFTEMSIKEKNKYIKDQSSKLAEKYTKDGKVDRQGILNRLKTSLPTETSNKDILVDYLKIKDTLNMSLNVEDYLDELNKLQSTNKLTKPDFNKIFKNAKELEDELLQGLSYILKNKNEQSDLLNQYASKLFSLKAQTKPSNIDTLLKTMDYMGVKGLDITNEQAVKSARDVVVFKGYGHSFNNLQATNNVKLVEEGLKKYIDTGKEVIVKLSDGKDFKINNKNYKNAFVVVGMNTFSDEQLADIFLKLNDKGAKIVADAAEKRIVKEAILEEKLLDSVDSSVISDIEENIKTTQKRINSLNRGISLSNNRIKFLESILGKNEATPNTRKNRKGYDETISNDNKRYYFDNSEEMTTLEAITESINNSYIIGELSAYAGAKYYDDYVDYIKSLDGDVISYKEFEEGIYNTYRGIATEVVSENQNMISFQKRYNELVEMEDNIRKYKNPAIKKKKSLELETARNQFRESMEEAGIDTNGERELDVFYKNTSNESNKNPVLLEIINRKKGIQRREQILKKQTDEIKTLESKLIDIKKESPQKNQKQQQQQAKLEGKEAKIAKTLAEKADEIEIKKQEFINNLREPVETPSVVNAILADGLTSFTFKKGDKILFVNLPTNKVINAKLLGQNSISLGKDAKVSKATDVEGAIKDYISMKAKNPNSRVVLVINGPDNMSLLKAEGKLKGLNPSEVVVATNNINAGKGAFDVIDGKLSMISSDRRVLENKKVSMSQLAIDVKISDEQEGVELGEFLAEAYGIPKMNAEQLSIYAQTGTKDDLLYQKRIYDSVIEITEGRAKVEGVDMAREYSKIQLSDIQDIIADIQKKELVLSPQIPENIDEAREKQFKDAYFWYENSLSLEQKDAARQSLFGILGVIPAKIDTSVDAKVFEATRNLSSDGYILPGKPPRDVYLGTRNTATNDYVASFLASNKDKFLIGLSQETGQDATKTYNKFGYNTKAIDEGYRILENAFKNAEPKKYEGGLDVNTDELQYGLVFKNYDPKGLVDELLQNINDGVGTKGANPIIFAYNNKIEEYTKRLNDAKSKEEIIDVYSDMHYYNNRFRYNIKNLYGEETKAEYYLQKLPLDAETPALKQSIQNDIVVLKEKVEITGKKINTRIKDIETQMQDKDRVTKRYNKIYSDGFVVESRGGILHTTTIDQEITSYLNKFSGMYDDIDEIFALNRVDLKRLSTADKQEALDLVAGLYRNMTTTKSLDLKTEFNKIKYSNDAVVTRLLDDGYVVRTDSTLGDEVISLPNNLINDITPGLSLQIDRSVKYEIFKKISQLAKKDGLTDKGLIDTVDEITKKYNLSDEYSGQFTAMFTPYLSVGNLDVPESTIKNMSKKDYTNLDNVIQTRRPNQTVTVGGTQIPVSDFTSLSNGKYFLDKGDIGIKTQTTTEVVVDEQALKEFEEKLVIVEQGTKSNIQKLDEIGQQAEGILSTNIDAARGTMLEYWKTVIQESGHGRAKKDFVEGFAKVFDDVSEKNQGETTKRLSEFYTAYQKLYDDFNGKLSLKETAPEYISQGNAYQNAAWALFQYNNGIKNSTANLAIDVDVNDILKNQHQSVLNLKNKFNAIPSAIDKKSKLEEHLKHLKGYALNVESGQILKQAAYGMKSETQFIKQFEDYNRFVEVFGAPKSVFDQQQLYNGWLNKPYIGSILLGDKMKFSPGMGLKFVNDAVNFLARAISFVGGFFVAKSQLVQYMTMQASRDINFGNLGLTASKYGIGDFADLDFLGLYDEVAKKLNKPFLGPGDVGEIEKYVNANFDKSSILRTKGIKFRQEAFRSPGNIADMLYRPMLYAIAIEDGLKTNGLIPFSDINDFDFFMKRTDITDQFKEDIVRAVNTRTTRSYEDITYFPQGVYGSYIGTNEFFALISGKANYGSRTNNMKAGLRGLSDTLFGFKSSRGLYGMDRLARVLRGGWSEFTYANKIGDIDSFMQRVKTEPRYNNLLKEMGSAFMAARIQEKIIRDEEEPTIEDKAMIILDAFENFTQMGASIQSNYVGRILSSAIANSVSGINILNPNYDQTKSLDIVGTSIKQSLGQDFLRPQSAVFKTASEVISMLKGDSSREGMQSIFAELSARSLKYDMEYTYSNAAHIEQTYVSRFNPILGSTSKEAGVQTKVNKLNKLMDLMGANDDTTREKWTKYLPVLKNFDNLFNPKGYMTRGQKNDVLTLLSETPQYMNYKLGGKLLGATTPAGQLYEKEVLSDLFKQDSQIGYGLQYELEKYINDGVVEKGDVRRILEASGVTDVEGAKELYDSLESSGKKSYSVADVQLLLQGAIGGNLVGASNGLVKTAMIKEYDALEKQWKKSNKSYLKSLGTTSVPAGVKEQIQRSVFNKYQESLVLTNRPEMDSIALSVAMRDNPKLSEKYLVDKTDKDGKPIKYNGIVHKQPKFGIEAEVFKMGEEMRAFEEGLSNPEKITSILAQDISKNRTREEASILLKMKMDYIDQLPMSYDDKQNYKVRIIQGNIGLAKRIDELNVDDDIKNGVKSQLFNTVRDATSDEMFTDIMTSTFGDGDKKGGGGGSGGGGGGKVSGDLAKAIKDITKAVQGNKSYTEKNIDYPKVDYLLQYAPSNKAAKRLGDLQQTLGIAKSEPFINIYNKGTTGKTTGGIKPRKVKKYVYKSKKLGAK